MGLYLKDGEEFDSVREGLKFIGEVVECDFRRGEYEMLMKIYGKKNDELVEIMEDKVEGLGLWGWERIICLGEGMKGEMGIMDVGNDED